MSKLTFQKPKDWMEYPFYKKIKYYGTILDNNYAIYVDKIEAKKIIKEETNDEIKTARVIKYLNEDNKFDDLLEEDIKSNYILKPSHGSGWNLDLSVYRDLDDIKRKLKGLIRPYSYTEKQYTKIKPRFFIEEKLTDKILGLTGRAVVYMFRCIHSKPVSIGVKINGRNLLYDTDWNIIVDYGIKIPKPKKLDLMLKYAEKLSSRFEFVRIDYYVDIHDDVYFSEYTFTPNGGSIVFNEKIEMEMGHSWI